MLHPGTNGLDYIERDAVFNGLNHGAWMQLLTCDSVSAIQHECQPHGRQVPGNATDSGTRPCGPHCPVSAQLGSAENCSDQPVRRQRGKHRGQVEDRNEHQPLRRRRASVERESGARREEPTAGD